MGIIADIQAASAVQKIKDGKSMASLSIAQITVLIVNMQDAKKNLSKQKFEEVWMRKNRRIRFLDIQR